ncbi:MAG TPA: ABC transporter ATP-binding protein [Kiloniellaceae bacterium]|nr:ABC transporter ATP-binding protein [Kiloniellaceae bacterium]
MSETNSEPQAKKPVILVEDLSLALPIYGAKPRKRGAKTVLAVGGTLQSLGRRSSSVLALDRVSFTIEDGDAVGLIGHNGAGKTSLLRVLGGIYKPTAGRCEVRGKISTLFTNAIGLNQNGTGLENIRLTCILMGMSKAETEAVVPDIVAFSELGDYLELPLRTYSAGMRTRLGFALATCMNPDILLIDEVFTTGDRAFRSKAKARMTSVMRNAKTVVLASQSPGLMKEFCNKIIWLEHGRLYKSGDAEDILEDYANRHAGEPKKDTSDDD